MKKVLILTYYWPPGTSPGVQRFLKFAKYLPEFGWEPVVLTVKNGSYPNVDPSLLEDVPPHVKVNRTKSLEPFGIYNMLRGKEGKAVEVGMANVKNPDSLFKRLANYVRANFFIPDARKGWNIFAWPAAKRLIQKEDIQAVITTGPPHSTHLIGLKIQRKLHLPWIADLRDPWTNIYYNKFLNRTERSKRKDRQLEDKVLTNADAVTVVSPGMKEEFEDRAKDITLIYNGYDREDFTREVKDDDGLFKLTYVGNLKPNQDIPAFWEMLAELCNESEIFSRSFQLALMGNVADNIYEAIEDHQLAKWVKMHPFTPHDEAVIFMRQSSALWLPIPVASNNKSIITGKIFEYLASRRPILAVGPEEGDANKILKKAGRMPMFDYKDKGGMKSFIETAFRTWQSGGNESLTHSENKHEQFSRYGMTQKLAQILDHHTNQ